MGAFISTDTRNPSRILGIRCFKCMRQRLGLLLGTLMLSVGGLAFPVLVLAQPSAQPIATARSASDTLQLSLNDALTRADRESFPVRAAEANTRAAHARKRQSLATFFPALTAAEEAATTTDPLNAFGFKLRQEDVTQADFAPSSLNDPDRIHNFTTRLEVEQPILNLDGLFQRRAASHAVRASQEQVERTRAVVAFRVKQSYYGLVLATGRLGVIDTALSAARRNASRAQDLYDEGIINRADFLAARVRVSELESQRADARSRRGSAADRLRVLLGLEASTPVALTDGLERERLAADTLTAADANRRRSDIAALRHRADAAQARVRARWTAFLPRVNGRAAYTWNDDVAFGTGAEGYTVGASLSWSLFDGFRQIGRAQEAEADVQRAEIALQQQSAQNAADISAAQRELVAARQRIRQATTAVEQAEESLRIRADRYAEGLAQTADLLRAEATLARSRLRRLQALYEHNVTIYRLELLTERSLTR